MQPEIYIINSPSFPEKTDFERFGVWCQWEDAEEVAYLKALCSSEQEYEEIIVSPYKDGKETYYPIKESTKLPNHSYLFALVSINITQDIELSGYVSTDRNEIVALTVWPEDTTDEEIDLYRSDRMFAKDENPVSVGRISNLFGIQSFSVIDFASGYELSNGVCVKGKFQI